jgi:hypothetical protein
MTLPWLTTTTRLDRVKSAGRPGVTGVSTYHNKKDLKMDDIVKKLKELGAEETDFVTLKYSDGADVWHINESYVLETARDVATAAKLGALLASKIPVYDTTGTPSRGSDVLSEMRYSGVLDEYDHEGWFAQYLTEQLVDTIYDQEYSLDYTTERYDYKRGFCNISTEVRVSVADLYRLGPKADSVVAGFEVSVGVASGTLTLG